MNPKKISMSASSFNHKAKMIVNSSKFLKIGQDRSMISLKWNPPSFETEIGSNKSDVRKKAKSGKSRHSKVEKPREVITPLSTSIEKQLMHIVHRLNRPGSVIIDISNDGPDIAAIADGLTDMGDCSNERHLDFYYRTAKRYGRDVPALLTTEDALDFKKARRTIVLFDTSYGIKFGAIMKQQYDILPASNEIVSELFDTQGTEDSIFASEKLANLKSVGVEFVMWRINFKSSDTTPSTHALNANCSSMAEFAVSAQKSGLVPVLSIEMEVTNDMSCISAHQRNYDKIFVKIMSELVDKHVFYEGLILCIKVPDFEDKFIINETVSSNVYLRQSSCHEECLGHTASRNGSISKSVSITAETIRRRLPPHIGGLLLTNQDSLKASLTQLSDMNRCPVPNWPTVNPCFSRVLVDGVAEHFRRLTVWPPRYVSGHQRQYRMAALDSAGDRLVANVKECSLCALGDRHAADRLPVWMGVAPVWVHECGGRALVDDSN